MFYMVANNVKMVMLAIISEKENFTLTLVLKCSLVGIKCNKRYSYRLLK